jgi:hypothetical protein
MDLCRLSLETSQYDLAIGQNSNSDEKLRRIDDVRA